MIQDKIFIGMDRFQIQKKSDTQVLIIRTQQQQLSQKFGIIDKPPVIEFQILIQEIIKANKIIIGHNISIDICLLYHNFIQDLPKSYQEFATQIVQYFPILLDNKLVANYYIEAFNMQKKMQNNLDNLFKECYLKELKLVNNVSLKFDFLKIFMEQGLHDAGYDSLITGICCICMSNMFNNRKQQINLLELYANIVNQIHCHGLVWPLKNIDQFKLLNNEKFLQNTIYGEFQDQELNELIPILTKQYTFEKTVIRNTFYITLEVNNEELINNICNSVKIQNLIIVPYRQRKRFDLT